MLNLKIIIGSTRPGRAADRVIPWITSAAREHGDFTVDVLDLRDWPLPLSAEMLATVGDRRQGRSGKVTAGSPAGRSTGSVPSPVAPSPFVRTVIRPMTKVLNPVIVKFAGRRHFGMAAQIQHVGRRSGKVYATPATAHVHGDVILIALTFGSQSDWVRNVRAAGGCTIRINGRTYHAARPRFLSREQAGPLLKAAFSPMQRAGTRMLGVRQFLRLQAEPARDEEPLGD